MQIPKEVLRNRTLEWFPRLTDLFNITICVRIDGLIDGKNEDIKKGYDAQTTTNVINSDGTIKNVIPISNKFTLGSFTIGLMNNIQKQAFVDDYYNEVLVH